MWADIPLQLGGLHFVFSLQQPPDAWVSLHSPFSERINLRKRHRLANLLVLRRKSAAITHPTPWNLRRSAVRIHALRDRANQKQEQEKEQGKPP